MGARRILRAWFAKRIPWMSIVYIGRSATEGEVYCIARAMFNLGCQNPVNLPRYAMTLLKFRRIVVRFTMHFICYYQNLNSCCILNVICNAKVWCKTSEKRLSIYYLSTAGACFALAWHYKFVEIIQPSPLSIVSSLSTDITSMHQIL